MHIGERQGVIGLQENNMMRFTQGQVVVLKSDPSVKGAIIGILDGGVEPRYQVFTNNLGIQTYYSSQLGEEEVQERIECLDASRFQA